jgi:hypothetical protein
VSLAPERAVVGQQVIYRLRILRREDVSGTRWVEGLSFPSLRAEWLPGRTPDPAVTGVGEGWLVFEEHRALFPAVPGSVEIPAARIGCRVDEGAASREFVAEVPRARLQVDPLPSEGRPADFAGVVGPVEVRSHLSSRRVELGRALTLAVTVAGEANVWAAAAPIDPQGELAGVDAYAKPPSTGLEPGRSLFARQTFAWELVPRRTGLLRIPPARVVWFDPAAGRYLLAESEGHELQVVEATGAPAAPTASAPEPRAAPARRYAERGGVWRLGLALALAGTAVAAWLLRRRDAGRRGERAQLESAERALGAGDRPTALAALSAALRTGLERRVPGSRRLAAEEIAARGDDAVRAAAALLARVEAARFAPAQAADPPDLEQIRSALRRL